MVLKTVCKKKEKFSKENSSAFLDTKRFESTKSFRKLNKMHLLSFPIFFYSIYRRCESTKQLRITEKTSAKFSHFLFNLIYCRGFFAEDLSSIQHSIKPLKYKNKKTFVNTNDKLYFLARLRMDNFV